MERWIVQHIKHTVEAYNNLGQLPVAHSHCVRVHVAKDIEARGYRVLPHGQLVRFMKPSKMAR